MLTEIEPTTGVTYGKLLLSPTRTYAPLVKKIFEGGRDRIHGMIHCSGGAQTKVLHFIEGLKVVKDNLFPIPPLFRALKAESGAEWEEMYKVFNMGHRMEIYTDRQSAMDMIRTAENMGIAARIIGRVESAVETEVELLSEYGRFSYRK